jgi:hypothetical protein
MDASGSYSAAWPTTTVVETEEAIAHSSFFSQEIVWIVLAVAIIGILLLLTRSH